MKNKYDIAVIGGGPAGSTTATILARKGYDVVVFEKDKFPRDHVGESLLPYCYQVFQDLGVLDDVKAMGYPKPGVTFSNTDGSVYSDWCFQHVISDESYMSVHIKRAEFDDMLLRNSEKSGATVFEETKVIGVKMDGEKVEIETDGVNGHQVFTTKFIVDASGQSTFLANRMRMKLPFDSLTRRLAISTHWVNTSPTPDIENGHIKIVHLEGGKNGWMWLIPLEKNRTSVGVALDMDYARQRQKELKAEGKDATTELYLSEVNSSPIARDLLKHAEQAMPVVVNGDFSYYAEEKFGEQYAIVGDASAFLDPIFSSGIYLGIKGSQLMCEGLDQWLQHRDLSGMNDAYKQISGAYNVVEKLIQTFYTEGSIKFAGADKAFEGSYDKLEKAYSILHLILAGDFFENHEKYLAAIDMLTDVKMIEKYKNLIKHPTTRNTGKVCQ